MFTRIFDEGRCVMSCGSGKYQRDSQCHRCHHTCHECDDEGPDRCTTCGKDKFEVERYLDGHECSASCPEGYYHSSENTCKPCSPNCIICTTERHCLRCSSHYYPKEGMCVKLECGVDELANMDDDCVPCKEGCQKCLSVNRHHCISCLDGYYQLESSCYKICPERTFGDDVSMICRPCDDRCVNCDGSQCYLCEKAFFLTADDTCVSRCEDGFYGDSERECEPCHRDCRSCGGPNHDDCDSCEDGALLVDGQCVNVSKAVTCLPTHFVNKQGDCEQCHFACKSCWGSHDDQCSACKDDMFLVADSNKCVSSCPASTFGNRKSGHCESCPSGCLMCQEAHRCLKCQPGPGRLYLQNGSCVTECQKGFPDDGVCRDCGVHCASCEDDAQRCLSCEPPFLLHRHACVARCPEQYRVRAEACERCPNGCATCDGRGQCSECEEYYFLHEDRCLDQCPRGYFTNAHEKKCNRCHADCVDCDGPDEDNCVLCRDPVSVLYGGVCLHTCPSDTYQDKNECRACDRSCLTCSGPGPTSCLSCGPRMRMTTEGRCLSASSCPPGTFSSGRGRCQPCQPNCLLCAGAGQRQCLACSSTHFLHDHMCVAMCPDGYYGDKERHQCAKCYATCATCSGHHSTNCLTCKAGHFRKEGSCVETCPSRHYGNATSGTCEHCDPSCAECSGSGAGRCLGCGEGYFLFERDGTCVHVCPPHYFPDAQQNVCRHCHPECKTCKGSGSLFCTSCYEGFRLVGGICSSLCMIGTYAISTGPAATCAECDPSCFECKGPGIYNCIGCHVLERLSEDGRCLTCCGQDKRMDSSPLPWECCDCRNVSSLDECVLGVNFKFHSQEELPVSYPSLVAAIAIFLLLNLGAWVFLFLHFRPKFPHLSLIKSNGYAKLDKEPAFTTATLRDAIQEEYCDKDEGEDEDEDEIVYMGQDGMIYRKFKYGSLDQEDEDMELEYDDSIHAFQ